MPIAEARGGSLVELAEDLRGSLGTASVRVGADLAPLTSFSIGGAADVLVEARGSEAVHAALRTARRHGVRVTLLGGGSNVLVSDLGVRGLVIRVRSGRVSLTPAGLARADGGLTISGLVRWSIQHGLGGVESWAGTPGTVGGAVYGNAHFQGRQLGELVESARVVDREGGVLRLSNEDLAFDYDRSRLQTSGEVLLTADLRVRPADAGALRQRARESLRYRKQTQPLAMPSAGCIFQNPDPASDGLPAGMLASAGALIDRVGLKGRSAGGIRISPVHANFFVNEGGGTAREVVKLIELCQREVKRQFGVTLREEIARLGEGI